ncbi:hypothetical protein V1509DRAFT_554409, partial [Lipomyces kononenkoae]
SAHKARSVHCHRRGLLFLSRYNKSRSMTGNQRIIVHVIPRKLEVLFIQNLGYIRLFAR